MEICRKLFSGKETCSANCAYCFAKWPNYVKQPILDIQQIPDGGVILYPCCDSDICENETEWDHLWAIATRAAKLYVSISTKRWIPDKLILQYQRLNQYLREQKKGFVKISISLTTKYQIDQIEPGTDDYYRRKQLFEQLQELGFMSSLIFKPILPFVSEEEYQEIITDFPTCDFFLLGDLYVHTETEFYKRYIYNQYPEKLRKILWLNSCPSWRYVAQDDKIRKIAQFIVLQGKEAFYSDRDVICGMIEREGLRG